MRIIYDNIIFSLQKTGGISVVWYELLKRITIDDRFICFFIEYSESEKNIFRSKLNLRKNHLLTYSGLLLKIKRYLNPLVKLKYKFIFHSSYYRISNNPNAINITTVHDFTYEYYSRGLKRIIHIYQKHKAIRKSDYIICISENTKNDLLKFVSDVDEKKIRVIYNGVSDNYFKIENDSINLPFVKNSYVIFVGARSGYKNFRFTVEVLSQSQKKLIIVGKRLNKEELKLLDSKIGRNRYKLYTHISDEFLNVLYNNAFCLLYPSKYEGFGIPILEAQKAGCPVIAYNGSSIPEIIGDKTLLFNDFKIDIILKLFSVLNNPDKKRMIIQAGIINASRFSWEKMSENIKDVYTEALNSYY